MTANLPATTPQDAEPADIAEALLRYSAAESPSPTPGYSSRQVAQVLFVAALVLAAFESEGLVRWAQRMDVGRVQGLWLKVLVPAHAALDEVGATWPRRRVSSAGVHWSQALGARRDEVLSQGWSPTPEDLETLEAEVEFAPLPEAPGRDEASPRRSLNRTVLLLGDSLMAGALSSALSSSLTRNLNYSVVVSSQVATGLGRPDVFDWLQVVPSLLEREAPTLVICSLGANDTTDLRQGQRRLNFGESAWHRLYRYMVESLMRALVSRGARVLWLGLPPMRSERFASRVLVLNEVFADVAQRVDGVDFLDLDMLVSGPDRQYATFGRDGDGVLTRMRLDDGVHYAPAGARRISRWVVDWARESVRAAQTISERPGPELRPPNEVPSSP